MEMFPAEYQAIIKKLDLIDPVRYARDRNYIDGSVTRLSPYISRGVITTKKVLFHLLEERKYSWKSIQKFIQELSWREYFQRVWQVKKNLNIDLKYKQDKVSNHAVPEGIVDAKTGILAIDDSIRQLYRTGYMHNHVRMYTASIACNIGQAHWLQPARWLYYHLLDADWASNALSWQWVAGAFSHKKYYANQSNINKFMYSNQRHTFLDKDYSVLPEMPIPESLQKTTRPELTTPLPETEPLHLNIHKPVLIYDFYNLDPEWRKNEDANRILLLEPSFFRAYPVSQKTMDFLLKLSENIRNIRIYIGEFDSLQEQIPDATFYYKEHPSHPHYRGQQEERDWLFPSVKGYYPSFSKYWKDCQKYLNHE